jgi:hypothetical protein
MLRVVAWVVALAAAAVTVAIVRAAPGDSLAGDSLIELAAEVAAGLLLMTAALVTRLSGAFRVLAAFAALAWLLVEWDSPGPAPPSPWGSCCSRRGRRCSRMPRCDTAPVR